MTNQKLTPPPKGDVVKVLYDKGKWAVRVSTGELTGNGHLIVYADGLMAGPYMVSYRKWQRISQK